jgi:hypothetical protein
MQCHCEVCVQYSVSAVPSVRIVYLQYHCSHTALAPLSISTRDREAVYLNYKEAGTRGLGYEQNLFRTPMERGLIAGWQSMWQANNRRLGLGISGGA